MMNTHVDFDTAKLLSHTDYNQKSVDDGYVISSGELSHDYPLDYMNGKAIAAPTIAETVMWLYEKYGIWIVVERVDPNGLFNYVIVYQDNVAVKESRGKGYKAPTEAYKAAITYTLKNLI